MRDGLMVALGRTHIRPTLMVARQLRQFLPHTVVIIEVDCGKLVGVILNRCTCDEFILPAGVPTSGINGRDSNVIADHVRQEIQFTQSFSESCRA